MNLLLVPSIYSSSALYFQQFIFYFKLFFNSCDIFVLTPSTDTGKVPFITDFNFGKRKKSHCNKLGEYGVLQFIFPPQTASQTVLSVMECCLGV